MVPFQMLYKPNHGELMIFRFVIFLKMIPISLYSNQLSKDNKLLRGIMEYKLGVNMLVPEINGPLSNDTYKQNHGKLSIFRLVIFLKINDTDFTIFHLRKLLHEKMG